MLTLLAITPVPIAQTKSLQKRVTAEFIPQKDLLMDVMLHLTLPTLPLLLPTLPNMLLVIDFQLPQQHIAVPLSSTS
jgi:hypothetical protein